MMMSEHLASIDHPKNKNKTKSWELQENQKGRENHKQKISFRKDYLNQVIVKDNIDL